MNCHIQLFAVSGLEETLPDCLQHVVLYRKSNPLRTLLYTIFYEKGPTFVYLLSVANGAPFHIPCLELCILLTTVNTLFLHRNHSQK